MLYFHVVFTSNDTILNSSSKYCACQFFSSLRFFLHVLWLSWFEVAKIQKSTQNNSKGPHQHRWTSPEKTARGLLQRTHARNPIYLWTYEPASVHTVYSCVHITYERDRSFTVKWWVNLLNDIRPTKRPPLSNASFHLKGIWCSADGIFVSNECNWS